MKDIKEEILSDAIQVAIENSETIVRQRIIIKGLSIVVAMLVITLIVVIAR